MWAFKSSSQLVLNESVITFVYECPRLWYAIKNWKNSKLWWHYGALDVICMLHAERDEVANSGIQISWRVLRFRLYASHNQQKENGQLLGQLFTCFCTQCVAQLNSASASGLSLILSLFLYLPSSSSVFSLLIVHSKSTCCRRSCVCPMFVWCLFEDSTGQGKDSGRCGDFPLLLALLISCSICCHCWAGNERLADGWTDIC